VPVDYRRVEAVAAAVADIYGEAEPALIALITRQLAAGLADEDGWAERKLREVRAVRRAATLVVDRLQRTGGRALRRAVADGLRIGRDAGVADLAERLVGDTGPVARGADTRGGAAIEALADATVREMRPVYSAVLRSTDDAYRRAIAGATARRLAGAQDLRHAAQAAWARLADDGITGFVDGAGRRWQLSTYVEMATRTAVARAAVIGQTDTWAAAGLEHCYVEDNPRECPICAPWEGKILALAAPPRRPATATLEEAQEAGLHHPNCRHGLRPWAPGVRIAMARKPEGPEGYEAEQQQRYLERGVRRWRVRYAAAFDDDGRQYAAARIQGWLARLEDHLDAHPRLERLSYRETVGAGYRPSAARRGDAVTGIPAGGGRRR
jgi:hypothetical protein